MISSSFASFFASFFAFYPTDFYADDLEIPKNIKFQKPFTYYSEYNKTDSIKIFQPKLLNFSLVNKYQPGIYEYNVWLKPEKKGEIFLKVFEASKNDQLSTLAIEERTGISIKSGEDSLKYYHNEFTIYEGDWGKPYGARVELWFKSSNGKYAKILQRNYIVEGWMR